MPKLTIYIPDHLAKSLKEHDLPTSRICQEALKKEIERMQAAQDLLKQVERIEVEMWKGDTFHTAYTVAFEGHWLVPPDRRESRTYEANHDAGAFWGVAFTRKGHFAVYTAHNSEMWPPSLEVYESLGEAIESGLPGDIADLAKAALGEDFVVELDI